MRDVHMIQINTTFLFFRLRYTNTIKNRTAYGQDMDTFEVHSQLTTPLLKKAECACGKSIKFPDPVDFKSVCARCWEVGNCGDLACLQRMGDTHSETCTLHPALAKMPWFADVIEKVEEEFLRKVDQ